MFMLLQLNCILYGTVNSIRRKKHSLQASSKSARHTTQYTHPQCNKSLNQSAADRTDIQRKQNHYIN